MKTNSPALRSGFLMLASLTAGATILPAQAQETTAATTKTAVISSVAILQTAAQSVSVRVDGEGKLDARAARLQNPDRLVLDFSGARRGRRRRWFRMPRGRYATCGWDNTVMTWCGW